MSVRISHLLITVLLLQSESCSSLRILGIFPFAGRSHFLMGHRILKEMAQRGHEIDMISQFPQKKPIPNYKDIVVRQKESAISFTNISYADTKNLKTVDMSYFIKVIGGSACDLLGDPKVQEVLKGPKGYYDVIVIELFFFDCYLGIGQYLEAPIVGVVTCKLYDWLVEPFGNPLNPSYMPSLFSSFSQRMTFWERVQNTITVNSVKYQIGYYMEGQRDYVEKYFGRKLSSIKELYDDVALVLINAHHSLNDIKPVTPDIIEVGGLHVVDDDQKLTQDLQKWLDDSKDGCVYFTFGSMINIETYPLEVLKVFYETFERIAPVRVLMKIADSSKLPPGLPKNVMTSKWLPQVAILKHKNVKLFITHGGLMGTHEAVAYKVPMIGLPIFADQYTNIKSYAKKNIAIALSLDEKFTAEALTTAITTILKDPTYRNNMEEISKLYLDRPMNAMDTAVYWVEFAAKNGKVLKSPATKLTWWQFYLLDVYGFILFSVLLSLYVVKKLAILSFKILRSLSSRKNLENSKKAL